jgi:hypothetical protein
MLGLPLVGLAVVPHWNSTESAYSASVIGRKSLSGDPACEQIAPADESDEMML